MKTLKKILYALAALVIIFILFLLFSTITKYRPEPLTPISENNYADTIHPGTLLRGMIWNIGYGGLSRDMDFFYDGGKQVRTSKEQTLNNLDHIFSQLQEADSIDFFLLQEIDKKSKRSYRIDQVERVYDFLPDYKFYFASNYKVHFVPTPPLKPLGKVDAGLVTASLPSPKKVTRHSFPGNYGWPVNLFMLERCFLVNRYPVSNGKELLVMNTHNSAYDDGSLKKQQMEYLKNFLMNEYQKGNYILVGGDWNQNPPENIYAQKNYADKKYPMTSIEADYLPDGWQWIADPETPTNRYLDQPYEKGKTQTTVIDFFLASPNIKIKHIKTIDYNFENSDHQPVICNFSLMP